MEVVSTHTLTQDVIDQYKADDMTKDRLVLHFLTCTVYRILFSVFMAHQHLPIQLGLPTLLCQMERLTVHQAIVKGMAVSRGRKGPRKNAYTVIPFFVFLVCQR